MKKFYLVLALFGLLPFVANSQTLLDEGFESSSTTQFDPNFPTGWSTIDSYTGSTDKYRWNIYYSDRGTISGTHVACCDAPMSASSGDGNGPREEILLTPDLTLDNTYQLSFSWEAASASALTNQEYDFQVRVVVDGDVDNAETIWSFQDEDMLKESGVTVFPWTGWQIYSSALDLSAWQGKTVKIAFVYKMLAAKANVVYLDNVLVKQFTPATTPEGSLTSRIYNFGEVYIGSKMYSDVITLTNEGTGGLTISNIDLPAGVSLVWEDNMSYSDINLGKNESIDFQVAYTASLSSTADGTITFTTSGGDLTLRVLATKVSLPADATFEGFENGCPPSGWSGNSWNRTSYALEGDYSAYATATMTGASYLTTPRLDLSSGSQSITFTCYDEFDTEDSEVTAPDNTVTLEFSKDGGASWETVWTSAEYNTVLTETVDLGTPASDNCYLRWAYSEIDFSSGEYDQVTSIFFLDAVILPKLYGAGGIPQASTLVSPENNATDVYNKNITIEWSSALFATGYKLYVGSDAAATNVVDGLDLGNVTSYTIASLSYATTYNWKVVPYNTVGDATGAETWSFTTIADQTVSSYPYTEGFDSDDFPPLGWNVERTVTYTRWSNNSVNPFDGKYSASVSCNAAEAPTSLVTCDFALPTTPMEISFYWGNDMPVALLKDETGLRENTSTADNGIEACFFEILADGEWTQLAILSDNTPVEERYWLHEAIDLSAYAGKTVSFRWRYVGHDYYKAEGAALDLVTIQSISDEKASFNVSEWNAGTVNYGESVTAKTTFSILNEGSSALKIQSVAFSTSNFSTTLAAGTEIASKKGATFQMTFNALTTAATVNDNLVVTFDSGYSVSLPVVGVALPSDTRYYDFEDETAGSTTIDGFTMIDVDGKATLSMTGMSYPQYGAAFAFCVQDDDDWNNVFDPVSGSKVLVAIAAADYGDSEDWLISQKLTATNQSVFHFYARNWNSVNSILPENPSNVEVLVSTTSNTDRTTFTSVYGPVEMPYYDNVAYNHYTVDLSAYAGQEIYVALRHYVTAGLAAFFDDFYFEHFSSFGGVSAAVASPEVGVYPNPVASTLRLKGADKADVTITNVAGSVVKAVKGVSSVAVDDLAPGVYFVTVATENGAATTRVIKK